MTELDLERDLPEDFEGRNVVIDGCHYTIGSFLGEGVDRITHNLINSRSGLSLLVIKIFRDQGNALAYGANVMQTMGALKGNKELSGIIPNQRLLQLHGGVFEIQDNVGNWGDNPEVSALIEQASLSFENKKYEEAQRIYTDILRRNPGHTVALNNLAATLVETGSPFDALPLMEEILTIEPNVCHYYQAYISVAGSCPYPRLAIEIAERMKTLFPYQCEIDDTIAEAYLECGEPQQARDLLERSLKEFDVDRKNTLDERIRRQLKGSEAAVKFSHAALQTIEKGHFAEAINALTEACKLHPYDPYSRANLGFTLRKTGEYKNAAMLLSTLEILIRAEHLPAIRFNAGLAFLQAGEKEEAANLLLAAVTLAESYSDGSIEEADLPGAAIWIEGKYSEVR